MSDITFMLLGIIFWFVFWIGLTELCHWGQRDKRNEK